MTCRLYNRHTLYTTYKDACICVLPFMFIEAVAFQNSRYGKGEKLAMAVKFICEGEESSLLECKYKTFNNIADKKCGGETAGVQCSHCKFT